MCYFENNNDQQSLPAKDRYFITYHFDQNFAHSGICDKALTNA